MAGDRRGVDDCLARVTLGRFKDTPSRVFSSGMKQRLKLAFALIHKPQILLLDEPMSNLDGEGKDIVKAIMEEHIQKGILVVATNERSEVIRHDSEVNLDHHG
jgi:ABC-type multidrug transport system ATPase subunit